jgi:hypothetical protein
MNADKDRATRKLLSVGLEPPDGDHNKHGETGLFASQNLRPSAFICGSHLHGCGCAPGLELSREAPVYV